MSQRLRCHSCSHDVGDARIAMQLVALFKASLFGRLPQTTTGEIRRRCGSCGWVNVFHPAATPAWNQVEAKA